MRNRIHFDKPTPRSLRWGSGILIGTAIAGAFSYHYVKAPDDRGATASSTATPLQVAIKAGEQPSAVQLNTAPPTVPVHETRSQEFDRLARGTPADALQAVKLLRPCEDANFASLELAAPNSDDDDPTFRAQQNAKVAAKAKEFSAECGDITAGQRTQGIPLAIKAAQAGVPGAFEALTRQEARAAMGADDRAGDPRDPRIIEAMPAIWDAYVKAGDPTAVLARYQRVSNCPDPANCPGYDPRLSLVLWTTYLDSGSLKTGDNLTARWIQLLGPDVAQAAIAEGHAAYANRSAK